MDQRVDIRLNRLEERADLLLKMVKERDLITIELLAIIADQMLDNNPLLKPLLNKLQSLEADPGSTHT